MGFSKLKKINLRRNHIFQPPDLQWVHGTLQEVIASENNIQSLDAFDTDTPFKYLFYVDMGSNNIRTFNVTLLCYLPQLKQLILYDNKLIHVDDFRGCYMGGINLKANPWHCDATLSWMGAEDMAFEKSLTCVSPPCVHGMAIANMSKQNTRFNLI